MDMLTRFRCLLIVAGCVAIVPLTAGAARRVTGVEPGPEHLAPVDPAWKAAGWRAVAPHAYVTTKLLVVRVAPEATADISYRLKGGVRVPVLEQRRDWWKIRWTNGRTGWASADAFQSRATVLLLDASTGQLRRRLAVKGQWGFLSEGNRLWSFANTGLTRMELSEPPRFWAYPVTQDPDGNLPSDGLLSPDRSTLFFPAREPRKWSLGRVDTNKGKVRLINAPRGRLEAFASHGSGLVFRRKTTSSLVDAASGKQRSLSGELLAIGRDGNLYLRRGGTLLHTDRAGKTRAQAQLPKNFRSATMTADGGSLAICYDIHLGDNFHVRDTRLRLLDPTTLRKSGGLALSEDGDRIETVLHGEWGSMVVSSGDGTLSTLTRYDNKGLEAGQWDATAGFDFDATRSMAFVAGENGLHSVPMGSGKGQDWQLSWRRKLPEGLLPNDPQTGVEVRPEISHITLSPDRKTLIVTERLAGDVAA